MAGTGGSLGSPPPDALEGALRQAYNAPDALPHAAADAILRSYEHLRERIETREVASYVHPSDRELFFVKEDSPKRERQGGIRMQMTGTEGGR